MQFRAQRIRFCRRNPGGERLGGEKQTRMSRPQLRERIASRFRRERDACDEQKSDKANGGGSKGHSRRERELTATGTMP